MHAKGDCQDLADSQADRQHGGQGAGTAGIRILSNRKKGKAGSLHRGRPAFAGPGLQELYEIEDRPWPPWGKPASGKWWRRIELLQRPLPGRFSMDNKLAREFHTGSLIRFALPNIVMMVFMSLYTIVDGHVYLPPGGDAGTVRCQYVLSPQLLAAGPWHHAGYRRAAL